MSEEIREGLSALVDGELEEAQAGELIDHVLSDSELKLAWERYYFVTDAVRNKVSDIAPGNLAQRVRLEVESEPVPLTQRRERWVPRKPVIGLALAASVATLAVIGVYTLQGKEESASLQPLAQMTTTDPVGMRWNISQPTIESRLNGYLVNHSEYLGNGMQGMHPYARIVGYNER
jgi:sigma-E factor negative regulatory protein RseA